MRVTSDLWVSALTRRVFSDGGFAAVVRHGATEAGAIFVVVRDRLGLATLLGPAPQSAYDSKRPDERYFALLAEGREQAEIDERLAKEARFDTDIWIIEIEPGRTPVAELVSLTTP